MKPKKELAEKLFYPTITSKLSSVQTVKADEKCQGQATTVSIAFTAAKNFIRKSRNASNRSAALSFSNKIKKD